METFYFLNVDTKDENEFLWHGIAQELPKNGKIQITKEEWNLLSNIIDNGYVKGSMWVKEGEEEGVPLETVIEEYSILMKQILKCYNLEHIFDIRNLF
jgi:hypothetical protein